MCVSISDGHWYGVANLYRYLLPSLVHLKDDGKVPQREHLTILFKKKSIASFKPISLLKPDRDIFSVPDL